MLNCEDLIKTLSRYHTSLSIQEGGKAFATYYHRHRTAHKMLISPSPSMEDVQRERKVEHMGQGIKPRTGRARVSNSKKKNRERRVK